MNETDIKPKILIIDDEKLVADTLGYMAQEKGYEVKICHEGVEGIKEVLEWHPTVILLDIMIPPVNGLEVVRELTEKDPTLAPRIILMTALSETLLLARALEYKVSKYITKNHTTPEVVMEVIEDTLRQLRGEKKV